MSPHTHFKRRHSSNAALDILESKALTWSFSASFSNPIPEPLRVEIKPRRFFLPVTLYKLWCSCTFWLPCCCAYAGTTAAA